MTLESPAFVPQVLLLMPLNQLAGTVHDCRTRSFGEKMLIATPRDEKYSRKSGASLLESRVSAALSDFSHLLGARLFLGTPAMTREKA